MPQDVAKVFTNPAEARYFFEYNCNYFIFMYFNILEFYMPPPFVVNSLFIKDILSG